MQREGVLRLGVIGASDGHAGLAHRFAGLAASSLICRSLESSSGESGRASLSDMVRGSDVIACMFPDDVSFESVVLEGEFIASARRGLRVLDFSPITPWMFGAAASRLAESGIALVGASLGQASGDGSQAPICVDDQVLEDGDLRWLVEEVAGRVVRAGAPGNSKTIGLLERHLRAVSAAASAEALALGEAAGIPSSVLVPLLLKGSGSTEVLKASQHEAAPDGCGNASWDALSLGLRQTNVLGRRIRHPSWFGAVAADTFGRAAGAGSGDLLRALLSGARATA